MDSSFFSFLMWFVIGAFSYKILSIVFGIVISAHAYHDAVVHILKLFSFTEKSFQFALKLKYTSMEKEGFLENEIIDHRNSDELIISTWKIMVIGHILATCPVKMQSILKFRNWDEAMRIVNEREEKLNA